MKTYSDLWEKFITEESFELAYINAIKHKSKQRQVREFKKNKKKNLAKVRGMVVGGNFHTSRYRQMIIYEPKERILQIPPYDPDRIIDHCVVSVVEPILMQTFIAIHTPALRAGGSTRQAGRAPNMSEKTNTAYRVIAESSIRP